MVAVVVAAAVAVVVGVGVVVMKIHIREDTRYPHEPYWIVGEGFVFSMHCQTHMQARLAAQTAREWYPQAMIVDHTRGSKS